MSVPSLSHNGSASPKTRILLLIVAYNAERTIGDVLSRIPGELLEYDTEALIIDDASLDGTFETSQAVQRAGSLPFKLKLLANPVNQGYGGNQKLGFLYALEHNFDVVALVHGDGQYAPEVLPELLRPVLTGQADVVLGSRMMKQFAAIRGGMPLYKYVGNRVLTMYQNLLLGTRFTEFHSGYRVYTTNALRQIPFERNANGYHFDTEIVIQLLLARASIVELPIPTYYGDEIRYVNGIHYARNVVKATTLAWLQSLNLVYRRNFDVGPDKRQNRYYTSKLGQDSTHSMALRELTAGQAVVDIGCGGGYLAGAIKAKGCQVIGVDKYVPRSLDGFDEFIQCDLDDPVPPYSLERADVILLLDVVEHLKSPEAFLAALHRATSTTRPVKILISTGNVGFISLRLMLLLGHFDYAKRGILDLTHTRLFTFESLRQLLEDSGFGVYETRGIPLPMALVTSSAVFGGVLTRLNQLLIAVSPALFAYQIFMVVRTMPTLETLLERSHTRAAERTRALA